MSSVEDREHEKNQEIHERLHLHQTTSWISLPC
jgi:hypothetical protein